MGASGPKKQTKKRRSPSAKEVANLQPNPQYLKRGGKKPRDYVTQPELDFLNFLLDGATKKDAWRWAGFPGSSFNCHTLLKRPLIESTFDQMKDERRKAAIDNGISREEEMKAFVFGEIKHRIRQMKTHKHRGDDAFAPMLTLAAKVAKLVESNKIVNNVSATASAAADAAGIDIYKPQWLRESEAKLLADAKAKYAPSQLEAPKLTPEKAQDYIAAANGDKEQARLAARADGWEF